MGGSGLKSEGARTKRPWKPRLVEGPVWSTTADTFPGTAEYLHLGQMGWFSHFLWLFHQWPGSTVYIAVCLLHAVPEGAEGDHLVGARKAQHRLQGGPVSAPHRLGLRCGYSDLHASVAQSDEVPSSHVWT